MDMTSLYRLSLTETSEALASGRLRARDLTEALLERIAQTEPRFHAFAQLTPARARAEADQADALLRAGHSPGPLCGAPVAVKDAIDAPDQPALFGNPVLHRGRRGGPSAVDSRLRAAGMVRMGALTLTEGVWVQHHSSVTEPVNPHGADHWTGNSSSGSGVALAAGMVPASVGTDTGGSIRLPSGCCGVTGLKPSWGRIGVSGVHPLAPSFDTVGPMARTARDVALLMDVLAGPDPQDPTSLRARPLPCRVEGRPDLRGLRLGLPEAEIAQADDSVRAALAGAADTFARLGATLVPLALPDPEPAIDAWSLLLAAEAARIHAESYPAHRALYGSALSALIERGLRHSGAQIIDAMALRRSYSGALVAAFEGLDAVLLPALPVGGPSKAYMAAFPSDRASSQVIGRYTVPFNMSGLPTLTLPCGRSAEGIPIGMQLCGNRLAEPVLCRIGAAYQDATDWHGVAPD
ncbi:amidase [Pseudooceanicola sp. CBS1P-1]|uniref:Amidase n=1 Tax=Pseudooceanicola albus TaxID=2692189 RepID=A0A6L7G562_9RHOB|nr:MULTISPECIES: amidase [Pseudooceanicola]MBT9385069.1 amidase [Pseudooceanicola endophyticus]MXN18638.1 amidase [Pseudooceanicola albus]